MIAVYETSTKKVRFELEEQSIIFLHFLAPGSDDAEHARMAHDVATTFEQLKKEHENEKPYRVLVDLSHAGMPSSEARTIYIKTLSDHSILKTAFFGAPSAIQAVVSFIASASGRGDEVQFFVGEKEARDW